MALTIDHRFMKWWQIWSFSSSLSEVKNAKKAENATANITVNPKDKGISRPQILGKA